MPVNVDKNGPEEEVANSKPDRAPIEMEEERPEPESVKLKEVEAVPYAVDKDVNGPPPEAMKFGPEQLKATFLKYHGEVVDDDFRNLTYTMLFEEYADKSTVHDVVAPDVVLLWSNVATVVKVPVCEVVDTSTNNDLAVAFVLLRRSKVNDTGLLMTKVVNSPVLLEKLASFEAYVMLV